MTDNIIIMIPTITINIAAINAVVIMLVMVMVKLCTYGGEVKRGLFNGWKHFLWSLCVVII